jgi:hypothetical protein
MPKNDSTPGSYADKRSVSKPRITTEVWVLYVQWDYGTTSWLPLRELWDSNAVEATEYSVTRGFEK